MCDNQGKCVSIYIFIQSQMLTLSLFTLSVTLSSLCSLKNISVLINNIISYCKPQVTGSCKNLVLEEFHV